MKVHIIRDIRAVADVDTSTPEAASKPLITRDGAKLVSLSITGNSQSAAVAGAMAVVLRSIRDVGDATTVYLMPGTLSSSPAESRYSFIVGVSGDPDIDKRLLDNTGNLTEAFYPPENPTALVPEGAVEVPTQTAAAPEPAMAPTAVMDVGPGEPEDAVIVPPTPPSIPEPEFQ